MNGLAQALRNAIAPPRDDLMDDLIAKLDQSATVAQAAETNIEAAQQAQQLADRLEKALCLSCGPNKFRLRRLKMRLAAAGQVS